MSRPAGNIKDRFDEKYIPEPNSGCWLWTSGTRENGYGVFPMPRPRPLRRWDYAHRASWELHHGAIPDGMMVLHKCDVRCCVNPDHLFLGTQQDNMDDAASKGRLASALNGKAGVKISVEDVREIRVSTDTPTRLALKFGASATHICAIQKGRRRMNVGG